MSYCRWSDMGYQCDVYCYEYCGGGYNIHVASGRYVFSDPFPPKPKKQNKSTDEYVEEQIARLVKVSNMCDKAKVKPIGLPYDGETFNESTALEAADRLMILKDAGYRVPQYAIDALIEEASENANTERET